mmetsp:Transcript_22100/g.58908  ORF Transcript_22100/g.58908 Transcript_22100/m.58908 type:complete len:275 (+) Transcript_22100:594-1418(+)
MEPPVQGAALAWLFAPRLPARLPRLAPERAVSLRCAASDVEPELSCPAECGCSWQATCERKCELETSVELSLWRSTSLLSQPQPGLGAPGPSGLGGRFAEGRACSSCVGQSPGSSRPCRAAGQSGSSDRSAQLAARAPKGLSRRGDAFHRPSSRPRSPPVYVQRAEASGLSPTRSLSQAPRSTASRAPRIREPSSCRPGRLQPPSTFEAVPLDSSPADAASAAAPRARGAGRLRCRLRGGTRLVGGGNTARAPPANTMGLQSSGMASCITGLFL